MMTVQKAADAVKFVFDALAHPEEVTENADMGEIHKALAPALKTWTNECNGTREIMLASAVGSVNYDLMTDTSDIDMKAIYMPTFSDFYHSFYPKFNFVTDAFDCSLTPAHQYVEFILKGSMNHFEVLSSPTCLARPDFIYIMHRYLTPMVDMNVTKNVYAAWFMGMKAHSDATKSEWKPKKAANALRILTFLIRFLDEGTYNFVITGELQTAIIRLKNGDMDALEYENLYSALFDTAKDMAFEVYESPKNYKIAKSVHKRDRTDTLEWHQMRKELDDEMMKLVDTS